MCSKNCRNLIFAFTIPILVTLIVWSILGIYPFGPRSVLSGDLLGQYDAITNYVRNNLFNGGLLFSNSVGLGINFFPILCYYVMSPINVIALFLRHLLFLYSFSSTFC